MQKNLDDNNFINVSADTTNIISAPLKPDYSTNPKHSKERTALRIVLNDIPNNPNLARFAPIQINGGQFYTKKAKVIYDEINKLLNDIRTDSSDIYKNLLGNFDLIDSELILKNCVKIQKNILGLMNYLPIIVEELKFISNKNDKLINIITAISGVMINSTMIGSAGTIHNTAKYFQEVLENSSQSFINYDPLRMNEMFQEIYSYTKNFYSSLNNIIDLLNDINATKYIRLHFNNFLDFNTFFTNNKTDTIENIFNTEIVGLNQIPSKLEGFISMLSGNEIQNKINLIEQFLYQIHYKSLNSYHKGPNSNLPRIGFLLDNTAGINNVSAARLPLVPLNLMFGTNSPDTTILVDAPLDLAGLLGKIIPNKKNKMDEVLPIIGSKLNEHINILKYYIVRYILQLSYDLLDNKIKNNTVAINYKKYTDLIFKMYQDILSKLQLNPNDMSTILIIIGSCVDKIITSNIQDSIMKGINRFSYKTNRSPETDTILSLLAQIKTQIPTIMSKENFDISNYLKDTKFLVEDIKSVVKKVIKTSQSEYLYDYAEDIFEKKVSESKIFKKFSQNIIDNDPASCYSLDYEIINLLLENRADVSSKDKEGSTVIFNAIDLNNIELVNKFVNLLPIYNKHSKNIFGITPLEHSLKHLFYFNKMFSDKQIVEDLVTLSSEIVSKKTQVTMQLRYHSEIYKIILILINHYIYSFGKEYINGWTNNQQQSLDNFLNMGRVEIPLLDTLNNLDLTSRDKYLTNFADDEIKSNDILKNRLKDIRGQIYYLIKEKNSTSIKPTPIRAKIIDQTIAKLKNELTSADPSNIEMNIRDMNTIKTNINTSKAASINAILAKNTNANITTDNLITIYESIQERIINNSKFSLNNDYKTYINLWKESIKTNNNKDINIIENISEFISSHTQIQNIPEMTLIQEYFNKIISKFALDYNELDFAYNSNNYVLNNIVKIVKHVLSNTVGVNLLNIIQQLLREELRIKHPYDNTTYTDEITYTRLLDEKIKKILETSNVNGISLDSYIMDELIEKLIKIHFNLYEDAYDRDNMEDINSIFMKINKLLESNVVLSLTTIGKDSADSSQIMKELREKIYPYFKDYLETNLKLIKRFIDGYMNSLINYGQSLNIYCVLLNKGFAESK